MDDASSRIAATLEIEFRQIMPELANPDGDTKYHLILHKFFLLKNISEHFFFIHENLFLESIFCAPG